MVSKGIYWRYKDKLYWNILTKLLAEAMIYNKNVILWIKWEDCTYMRIGICDDESIIRRSLNKSCEAFRSNSVLQFEIVEFVSGESLLRYEDVIDILFLDIQMKGINGLHTAMKIREHDDNMVIIFLTGYKGYMQEGYRVQAFRYLIKPLKEDELIKVLNEAIAYITKNKKVVLGKDGTTYYMKLADLVYIESLNRTTVVRTKLYSFESNYTMGEWEETLNNGDFYRLHKSYIVNMEYVEEVNNCAILENGEKVEISIRQLAKFKKACKEYRRRKAR